jgi:hypothetical protein
LAMRAGIRLSSCFLMAAEWLLMATRAEGPRSKYHSPPLLGSLEAGDSEIYLDRINWERIIQGFNQVGHVVSAWSAMGMRLLIPRLGSLLRHDLYLKQLDVCTIISTHHNTPGHCRRPSCRHPFHLLTYLSLTSPSLQ